MRKTPFSLLLSGIALILFGFFLAVISLSQGWPSWGGWFLILLGVGSVITAFVWVQNLSEETRRKLMTFSPPARRLFWPFTGQLSGKGADLNAKDQQGETALMRAAAGNKVKIVKALINGGADVSAKDNRGHTALMRASEQRHTDVIALLKEAGARE